MWTYVAIMLRRVNEAIDFDVNRLISLLIKS